MRHINNAILKDPSAKVTLLALFQVERGVYHWRTMAGQPYPRMEADFLDAPDAIKALRVLVEGDPAYVGWDLTIKPVAPPPEERAAQRIVQLAGVSGHDYGAPSSWIQLSGFGNAVAEIIRNETAIDKLLESINDLVTYRFRVLRMPKPPGLDMIEGGLLLEVIAAVERATASDLSNLKRVLSEKPSEIQVVRSGPGVKPC